MRRLLGVVVSISVFIVLFAPAAFAQSDYPPSIGPGEAGRAPGVPTPGAAGRLARTGADNTPSLILIGVAALVVGLVLVLAVRRRRALARGIA